MNTILKSMRTPASAVLALVLATTGLSVFSSDVRAAPPVERPQSPVVEQAIGALRAISTMRADFIQTDRSGQRIGGVMTLQRPGRIRFQYQQGVPFLIVSDGSALTMIDYEVRQVQRWPIRNSPLGALLDPNKDVARNARLVPTGNPSVLSIDIKDPRHPEYGTITLIMIRKAGAPGGWELDSWVALDAQARRTTVRLSNHKYGIEVPANMFRFNDPRNQSRKAG